MKFNKGLILTAVILILILIISSITTASALEQGIVIDNPYLMDNTINKTYDLLSANLRLPVIDSDILNVKSQNKLFNLVSLYGSRDDIQIDENFVLIERLSIDDFDEYSLDVEEKEDRSLSLSPLPGVSVDADYNKEEEENKIEENTNVSLKYWMNNRTLIRAEYGMENREWWDIRDIDLEDGSNFGTSPNEHESELTFNEEKNQRSSLGVSFQTNDRVTISADYIDSTSVDKDFSTVFGVEYKDDIGTLKYHYQVDFGDQSTKETGLEYGYKDLATFNATYKIFDPKVIQDQLNKSIMDIGVDVNLNDISTISLGYQLQKRLSDPSITDDEESNIQAELKIKF